MQLAQPKAPISVSQLNRQVKQILETNYPAIPVKGEISTLSRPASGHIYFTLKDKNAQLKCAMFKSSLLRNRYIPKQGDEVIVTGRVSLYEGRGDYQLIANSIQPMGEGALQAAFFQLKERLSAEGLFNEENKKPLPTQVSTVGIVTSSTGAALHDILTVLQTRFPAINVVLYPTQVQGNEASQSIVNAIKLANSRKETDVLIVGRGGGSLEDLWCFNTEPVAKAIFQSKIPVISAVGHEVDMSISDYVADVRAATPSQAAELISPDQFELMQRLDQLESRLIREANKQLTFAQHTLAALTKQIRNPSERVFAWKDKLISLESRLRSANQLHIQKAQFGVSALEQKLLAASPSNQLIRQQQRLEQLETALHSSINSALAPQKNLFHKLIASLNVLSPLATLERGYSITRNEDKQVIQSSSDLSQGDLIETIFKDGKIISKVESKDS